MCGKVLVLSKTNHASDVISIVAEFLVKRSLISKPSERTLGRWAKAGAIVAEAKVAKALFDHKPEDGTIAMHIDQTTKVFSFTRSLNLSKLFVAVRCLSARRHSQPAQRRLHSWSAGHANQKCHGPM